MFTDAHPHLLSANRQMVVATEHGLLFVNLQTGMAASEEVIPWSELESMVAFFCTNHDLNFVVLKTKAGAGRSDVLLDVQQRNQFFKNTMFVIKQNSKAQGKGDVDTRDVIKFVKLEKDFYTVKGFTGKYMMGFLPLPRRLSFVLLDADRGVGKEV